jgi:CHAP domain
VLYGTAWFNGSGVNVCSDANGGGSDPTCGGQEHVGGISGAWWQCVELAQRFYKTLGWYSGTFKSVNVAADIYANAGGLHMTRQANGKITSIVPGDMIVHGTHDKYSPRAGHVAIVDHIVGSTVYAVQENVAGKPATTYTLSGGTLSGGSGTDILGIVHSPKDKFTGKVSPVPPPTMAPCTKPLLGPVRDCSSTSPTVDRWFNVTSASAACTFGFTIDWGDGAPDSTTTLVNPGLGEHLLASHKYAATTQASYTITVHNSVLAGSSGSCSAPPTTIFGFTHLLPNHQPWWTALSVSKACVKDLTPNPIDVGLTLVDLGETIGVFEANKAWGVAFAVLELATHVKAVYDVVFKMPQDCIDKAYSLGPLPRALAYGASHPGKLFKPKSGLAAVPQIKLVGAYQKGVLDYFRLTYSDPRNNAKGFGFVGINGAGWGEENHPFTAPSYGIVGHDTIDYPFNLLCGTAQQYSSYVEAWIYNSQGIRSYPVQIALTCT